VTPPAKTDSRPSEKTWELSSTPPRLIARADQIIGAYFLIKFPIGSGFGFWIISWAPNINSFSVR
jgi:hypothetical protein